MSGSDLFVGTSHAIPPGHPRVLAYVRSWSPDRETAADLDAIRSHLRGLGAELIVLADGGVWSFGPDDEVEYSDRLAGDPATAAMLYGGRDGDAVYVIDGNGEIRFAHRTKDPLGPSLVTALGAAVEATLEPEVPIMFTRRDWLTACLVAGFTFTLLRGCQGKESESGPPPEAPDPPPREIDIVLMVNGKQHPLRVEGRVSLLDALRERIGLTGTKKGCDNGACGSCTVLVDGKRVLSCLTLAAMVKDKPITTVEGLANAGTLHPVQAAFMDHDALQCGYCTPGQITSAVGLIAENHAYTDDEVREGMSGNLCRCGAYPNIVAAIQAARKRT